MDVINNISEKLLLCNPNMVKYYRQKYKIYTELNLPFDLFFFQDIINYKDDLYKINVNMGLFKISCEILNNPILMNEANLDDGFIMGRNNTLIIFGTCYADRKSLQIKIFISIFIKSFFFTRHLTIEETNNFENLLCEMRNGTYNWIP